MLKRVFPFLAFAIVATPLEAIDKDHLQRGEPVLNDTDVVKYHRTVRQILSRGWQSDVVLRTVVYPPWESEAVIGLYRQNGRYYAFVIRPSDQIWQTGRGFGEPDSILRKRLSSVHPIFHSRLISDPLAVRIAALFRRVLSDPRNYSKDDSIYLDTSSDTFYLAFAPHEHIVANMIGWGGNTQQLLWVNEILMSYALGKAEEAKLDAEVSKREKSSASSHALERTADRHGKFTFNDFNAETRSRVRSRQRSLSLFFVSGRSSSFNKPMTT